MRFNKPTHCPDAIATDAGWVNPKNGELLVSHRGLKDKIFYSTHIPEKPIEKIIDTTEYSVSVSEEVTTDTPVITKTDNDIVLIIADSIDSEDSMDDIPKKKKAGRPKKVKADE